MLCYCISYVCYCVSCVCYCQLSFFSAKSYPGILLKFWVQTEKRAICFMMESPVVSFTQLEEGDWRGTAGLILTKNDPPQKHNQIKKNKSTALSCLSYIICHRLKITSSNVLSFLARWRSVLYAVWKPAYWTES